MKNEKGITLVALVITIILMMILLSVSIETGFTTYENMKVQAFIAKMITVQEAVDKLCDKYSIQEINEMGSSFNSVENDTEKNVLSNLINVENRPQLNWYELAGDSNTSNYRYFSIDDISSILGIKDFDTPIFFNPRTRNVIAAKGVKYKDETNEDKMYYRQYDLPGGQSLSQPNIDTDFTLNCNVKTFDNKAVIYVNATKKNSNNEDVNIDIISLKYSKKNGNKYGNVIISDDLDKITITESGIYQVVAETRSSAIQDENSSFENLGEGVVTKSSEDLNIVIVNKPMLVAGMTPIKYTQNGEIETPPDENYEDWYKDWYNYGDKRWANVMLNDKTDENKDGSIYVWIPRYAYSIDENNNINIEFMKGVSSVITTSGNSLASTYRVIPAFEDGTTTGFAYGEWDSELFGIWVAKYEAIETSNYAKSYSPNSNATTGKTISEMVTCCNNIKTTVTGMNLSNVDTHLMKNSEWGAVSYLTHSEYGNTSLSPKSGFNTKLTSTNTLSTGNYYGIEGLSGGVQEAVSAGIDFSDLNIENVSTKYFTLYNSVENDNNIYGDGVNEINWNIDNRGKEYPIVDNENSINNPFFARGGYNNGASLIGNTNIFTYLESLEAGNEYTGFRPVLIVEY